MGVKHENLAKITRTMVTAAGVGTLMKNDSGKVKCARTGRWVIYGLGNIEDEDGDSGGGADLIGIHSHTGKFLGVEIKIEKDFMKKNQIRFKEWILRNKGLHYEIRSVEDSERMVDELKRLR